ncbi:MAG: xylulokinase [Fimbriimonadaceae bacterium]|nr:xylulokinase [Fimbriimonadaceae bacterium]
MPKLLGIDIGTSGTKAVLIDEHGKVLKQASAEYPISIPQPGWSEQNPEDWWAATQEVIAGIGDKPDAIGLTGQMHGAVFLDAQDAVIRPAILWNDQRTIAECEEIDARVGKQRVREITCNPPLTGFQAPKILWLRKNEPESFSRLRSALLPKDYVRLMLTGKKATDVSDASGVGLFDVVNRTWSHEMAKALDLEDGLFPQVYESDEITAMTADGIAVIAGGGDQAAGAVGTGAVAPGVISLSLGTSGVVFTSLKRPEYDPEGASHTFAHANREWHAMGVMLSCGGAVRWFRDTIARETSYDKITESAMRSNVGANGVRFLPYLTGERCPHNDPSATGSFSGLRVGSGQEDMARALFEGVSFGLLEGFEALQKLGANADILRVIGGGARSSFWMQLLADVFQKPCVRVAVDEGPAFGAAILAGVGIGLWPNVAQACKEVVQITDRFEPSGEDYSQAYRSYKELYRTLKPWMKG